MKKFLTGAGAAIYMGMSLYSGQTLAYSTTLNDAFNDAFGGSANASINDPSYLRTQTRNSISLGSGRITTGSPNAFRNRNLISIQPNISIQASCTGLNWQLAGVSWITGEQLKQMLEAAIPAAAWYVVQLVLMAICGDCATALSKALENIQRAVNMLSNSCEVGQHLVSDLLSNSGPVREEMCNRINAKTGEDEDYGSARSVCENNKDHVTFFGKMYQTAKDGQTEEEKRKAAQQNLAKMDMVTGNLTWNGLKNLGLVIPLPDGATSLDDVSGGERSDILRSYYTGMLFMSLLGTTVFPDNTGSTPCNENSDNEEACKQGTEYTASPMTDPMLMLGFFMCGFSGLEGSAANSTGTSVEEKSRAFAAKECETRHKATANNGNAFTVIACAGDFVKDWNECTDIKAMPLQEWKTIVSGSDSPQAMYQDGFLFYTMRSLLEGVDAIEQGTVAIPESALRLIEAAPFPLYKLMNMAALYPGARGILMGDSGVMISYLLAENYMNQIIVGSYRNRSILPKSKQSWEQMNILIKMIGETTRDMVVIIDQAQERAERFSQRIAQMERQVLRSIYSKNMFGSYAFATASP